MAVVSISIDLEMGNPHIFGVTSSAANRRSLLRAAGNPRIIPGLPLLVKGDRRVTEMRERNRSYLSCSFGRKVDRSTRPRSRLSVIKNTPRTQRNAERWRRRGGNLKKILFLNPTARAFTSPNRWGWKYPGSCYFVPEMRWRLIDQIRRYILEGIFSLSLY